MSRFDRYVFRECLGPVFIGVLVATGTLLTQAFFNLTEAMIQRDVPFTAAVQLLLLNLPHIVVVTLPMGLLFGILLAIGRLSADSELTAMRASGVSLIYLYRPILTLSLLLAGLNVYLMVEVLPWGNRTLQRLTITELLKGSQARAIEPRVFNDFINGKTLYIFEQSPTSGRWNGVFLADALPIGEFSFTVASEGDVRIENGRIVVDLDQALDVTVNLEHPEDPQIAGNEKRWLFPDGGKQDTVDSRSISPVLREMTLSELRVVRADTERLTTTRRRASVDLHKKFSIPAVCLVFGFLALPLGFNRHAAVRSGKQSAFVQALGVIVGYHILISVGEEAAVEGTVAPWQAMWLPNLLLLILGAFLLARKNEDKTLLLSRIDRFLRFRPWRRSVPSREKHAASDVPEPLDVSPARATAQSKRLVLRLPHLAIRFPSRIDRYVLRLFAQTLLLVSATCIALYVVIDIAGLSEYILTNDVAFSLLLEYYFYYSLQIFYLVAPIAALLTTLIVFGILSRSSEITAAKAIGISLYRLAVPALFAGLVVAVIAAALDASVLPAANARQAEIRATIKGRAIAEGRQRRITRQWYYSDAEDGGSFIYNYGYRVRDSPFPRLQGFQAFRFDAEHRLTGHYYARELRQVDGEWSMHKGWARTFKDNRSVDYVEIDQRTTVDLREADEFFSTEIKSSLEMNYWELQDYVARLESSGQRVPHLELQALKKVSMPVVSLVMVLVALPFAFRLGRQGALYGVGIAVVLGIGLFAVLAIFESLGETATIPPAIAAWSPNALFTLFSAYLFLGVRS